MDRERVAATIGLAACLVVLALSAGPYVIADPSAVATYYAAGPAGPPLVSLFSIVVAIVLAAGVRRRTDPALAAGIAVAFGAFVAAIAWWWALSVSPSLVGGFTTIDAFEYHRWALGVATLGVPVAGGLYARAVL